MLRELFRRILNKLIDIPSMNDNVGISDNIEIVFIKDGKEIERRNITGHTWTTAGKVYLRDCLRLTSAKTPVSSMSAFTTSDNWSATEVDNYNDSPTWIKWKASWAESGALSITGFQLGRGAAAIWSSISASFTKPDGVSLDTYWTSTITS